MLEDEASRWVVDPATQVELEIPSYGTADEAILRAAKMRVGTFRTITFGPDYGNDYPFWESDSANYTPDASELGLSADLAAALRLWQERWEAERLWATEWNSEQRRLEWERDGDALCERLRAELWLIAELEARYRAQPTQADVDESE